MDYYSEEELALLGLKSVGKKVRISKKTSIYSPEDISIGNNVRIDDFCILSGKITIGNNVHISAYSALYGKYGIEIDDYSGCSPKTIIFSGSDDFSGEYMVSPLIPSKYTNVKGNTVYLKKYVQIGANSVVMPGIILGEGTAVGAMSFVNKSTSEWSIYAGIPVKKIKERSKKILDLVKEYEKENIDNWWYFSTWYI